MSVRAAPLNTAAADLGTAIAEVQPEAAALGEGNSFATSAPENPLTRNVVVSIRASLNDLCLQKAKGTWSPTPEALKSIFQQKKFVTLEGGAEAHGDLKVRCPAILTKLLFSSLPPACSRSCCTTSSAPTSSRRSRSRLAPQSPASMTRRTRRPARRSPRSASPTPSRRRNARCRRTM